MELTTSLIDAARRSLNEDGFCEVHSPDVGSHITSLERRGFPLLSTLGFRFLKQNVLENPCVRGIIEASLEESTLGHWLRYRALPGHIESFFQSGQQTGLCGLAVQLCSKGSKVTYYRGSHRHVHAQETEAMISERGLHEKSRAVMDATGYDANERHFEFGGIMILDARTSFEIREGYQITCIFVTEELIRDWPKIIVPDSQELTRLANSMQSPKIKINFEVKSSIGNKNV